MSIALSSVPAFTGAVGVARRIDFAAYTLRPGAVRTALVNAARDGAAVRVRLERDPLDDAAGSLHAANVASVELLARAGADAALTPAGAPVEHLKAAVVDGVAWLDDRNWAGGAHETVVRDSDPADVGALAATLAGMPQTSPSALATTKAAALRLEAEVIAAAGPAPLAVESESFGGGGISAALAARGRAGRPTRLLVAGREADAAGSAGAAERARLVKLAALGIDVRVGSAQRSVLDEKLAVSDTAAWIGSANATFAAGPAGEQRDWGVHVNEPAVIAGVRAAFERNWDSAAPLQTAGAAASRER